MEPKNLSDILEEIEQQEGETVVEGDVAEDENGDDMSQDRPNLPDELNFFLYVKW